MAGRRPAGRRSILVGVAGGSGSGKTTVVREVVRRLGPDLVTVIEHDAYYRDLSGIPLEERHRVNFDHPDSLETPLLADHLGALLQGRSVQAPTYDFSTHTRSTTLRTIHPTPVVLLDGILVLAEAELRALMDLAVYVQAGVEERLARRLRRDVAVRGRSQASVIEQFHATVSPMHDRFVEPSRAHADLTILGGGYNERAIGELVQRLRALLAVRA